jgi:ribosome-associated toxin RatA of RatAB toxin-antitoxin module
MAAAACACLAPAVFAAGRSEAGAAGTEPAAVRVWDDSGNRRVEASVWVPHDSSAVWPVVLDYDGLAKFMPNVVSSRVVQRKGPAVIVRQVGRGRFIFRKTLRFDLEFRRGEPSVVSFRQVSGDFQEFSGSWTVHPEPRGEKPGSRIVYAAAVRAGMPLPGFVARRLLRQMAAGMMPALAREIARRNPPETSARSGDE